MAQLTWKELEKIYEQAQTLNASEWPRYLDRVCGNDVAGRARVEKWLGEGNTPPAVVRELSKIVEKAITEATVLKKGTALPGRYIIQSVLGIGGMGVVYRAEDRNFAPTRDVAIKMIAADVALLAEREARQRFRDEAGILARLKDERFVRVHSAGEWKGCPFLVMELVESPGQGVSLQEQGQMPMPPKEAARLVESLAEAMFTVHEVGIVHCDLKPANILMAAGKKPKITDFGIAALAAEQEEALAKSSSYPATKKLGGTNEYMAPEQWEGNPSKISPRTDIYALGAILYKLLTGLPPFVAEAEQGLSDCDYQERLHRLVIHKDSRPAEMGKRLPRDLQAICKKCLEKEAEHRYETARQLAEDLQRFGKGEPLPETRPVGPVHRLWYWCCRNPVVMGIEVGGFGSQGVAATNCIIQNNILTIAANILVGAQGGPTSPVVSLKCLVQNNLIHGNGIVGGTLGLLHVTNCMAQGNAIIGPLYGDGTGEGAIELYYANNNTVEYNHIEQSSPDCSLRLRGSHGNVIQYNFGSGDAQPFVHETEGSSGNTIQFNNFQVSTLFVDPSGRTPGGNDAYPSIQAAVNAAAVGDTIQVDAGTYNENVSIPASDGGLILDGAQKGVNPTQGRTGPESIINGSLTIAGNYVTVDGFTVVSSANWCIQVNGESLVENCIVQGLTPEFTYGVWVSGDGNTVASNYVQASEIYLNGAPDSLVVKNKIVPPLMFGVTAGVDFLNSANSSARGNEIDNVSYVFGIRSSEHLVIIDNFGTGVGPLFTPAYSSPDSTDTVLDNNFPPSAQATVTTVSSSANPSLYGQPITFTATVASGGSPVSTGTVTFQEGTTVLATSVPLDSNGHASFQIATLTAVGSPHTITAYYSGTASLEASSGRVTETVSKSPLIVVAAAILRPYGTANPTLNGAVVGIQNNDSITATYSTAATPASPIGSYTIVPTLSDGGTGKLANYTPTIIDGTLTITPAPLIVTPANVTREFDTPNPPLMGTVIGIQNGDNITASYSTTATLTSPVGTYPITATLNDPDNKLSNYSVTLNQGTLTVTAAPLLVTTTADSGPGSLRNVLLSAPAGSTVHFWSGVSGTITLTSGVLSLTQDVSIAGPGASLLTISGNKLFRVFQIASAATVTISGLTIANGNSTGSVGGGIYNDGTLTVTSSTISGNFASPRGGGIFNSPSGTLTLDDSLISGNSTANAGGGIFNEGTLTVSASTLTGNGSTNADGGAIFNLGTLIVSNSTLSGNGGSGAYGGAIRNDRVLTVEQSTLSGNSANLGGAVYNVGTLVVNHSTLSGNTAAAGGGGIDNTGAAVLIARDTIFAGNAITTGTGPDISGVLTSLGHNLVGNRRGASGFMASDLLNVNPLLGPLQNNGGPTQTMALLPVSPAIDAGDNAVAPAYDQRGPGYPRIIGSKIDIGAYEFQPTLTVTSSADDGQPGTLRYALAHADNGDRILITPAVQEAIVLTQGELLVNKDLTIEALGNAPATISGNNSTRVFDIASSAHVTLTNLTVSQGFNSGNGGGIYNAGTLTINRCALLRNATVYDPQMFGVTSGGGIYNIGTLTVSGTAMSGNFAGDGGAIENQYGTVFIDNCSISTNSCPRGGAAIDSAGILTINHGTVSNNDGSGISSSGTLTVIGARFLSNSSGAVSSFGMLTISQSLFSGNSAYLGGAVSFSGTAMISDSTLLGNTAFEGGGIANGNSGTIRIINTTISDNRATDDGGAIFTSGPLIISNCVLSGNSAQEAGGAIYNSSGTVTITNTFLSGNSAEFGGGIANGGGDFVSNGGTLTITISALFDNSAGNEGGGIYNASGPLMLNTSTVVGNTAPAGADVFIAGGTLVNNASTIGVLGP